MTEHKLAELRRGWKVYDLKPSPSLCCNYRRDGAGMVARSLRSAVALLALITAGLLQILSNLAMITAMR